MALPSILQDVLRDEGTLRDQRTCLHNGRVINEHEIDNRGYGPYTSSYCKRQSESESGPAGYAFLGEPCLEHMPKAAFEPASVSIENSIPTSRRLECLEILGVP